ALIAELESRGFATPIVDAEIPDPASGTELAVAEAFWPDGLQHGVGSRWFWNSTQRMPTCPGWRNWGIRYSPPWMRSWASSRTRVSPQPANHRRSVKSPASHRQAMSKRISQNG